MATPAYDANQLSVEENGAKRRKSSFAGGRKASVADGKPPAAVGIEELSADDKILAEMGYIQVSDPHPGTTVAAQLAISDRF